MLCLSGSWMSGCLEGAVSWLGQIGKGLSWHLWVRLRWWSGMRISLSGSAMVSDCALSVLRLGPLLYFFLASSPVALSGFPVEFFLTNAWEAPWLDRVCRFLHFDWHFGNRKQLTHSDNMQGGTCVHTTRSFGEGEIALKSFIDMTICVKEREILLQ